MPVEHRQASPIAQQPMPGPEPVEAQANDIVREVVTEHVQHFQPVSTNAFNRMSVERRQAGDKVRQAADSVQNSDNGVEALSEKVDEVQDSFEHAQVPKPDCDILRLSAEGAEGAEAES